MRVAVLSPHRDDAAFSCGLTVHALLRSGAEVTLVNVFTRSEYAVDLSTVDATLPPVAGVSAARLAEDRSYMADAERAAGCEPGTLQRHDLAWLDAPLRLGIATERVLDAPLTAIAVEVEAAALAGQLQVLLEFDLVLAPLALGGHVDHVIARAAAARLLPPRCLCWYEDLPYAARMPPAERQRETLAAVASMPGEDFCLHALRQEQGTHLKTRFAMHYPSQIGAPVAQEIGRYAGLHAPPGWGAERFRLTVETAGHLRRMFEAAGSGTHWSEEQS